MESWFLDGKSLNSAEMVFINFLSHSLHIAILLVRAKIRRKSAFFSKSHKTEVTRVFWHVEFISALKTQLNPTVFEKNPKSEIKYLIIFYILWFSLKVTSNWHCLAPSGILASGGRLAPSGTRLAPYGAVWHPLALSGAVWHWHRLAPSGTFWHRLEPSGTVWHTISGTVWRRLALSGTVWRRLAPSGTAWPCLALSGAPSGAVWRPTVWHPLAPSGTAWHRLGPSGTVWHGLAPSGTIWHRLA